MAEILAKKTSLAGHGMPGTFEAVRAEALFASTLQPSGSPSPDQVRRAVTAALPPRWPASSVTTRTPR
jgi:hypothetical protein